MEEKKAEKKRQKEREGRKKEKEGPEKQSQIAGSQLRLERYTVSQQTLDSEGIFPVTPNDFCLHVSYPDGDAIQQELSNYYSMALLKKKYNWQIAQWPSVDYYSDTIIVCIM